MQPNITDEMRIRIFGSYGIGAPVIGNIKYSLTYDGIISIISKKWLHIEEVVNCCESNMLNFTFDNCALSLYDLSEITDEDKIEVAEMMSQDDNNALDPNDVPAWLDEVLTGNCATYADYVSGNEVIHLIDYLRSKSYMIPYMGINLFTAGIAVKRERI